MSVVQQKPITVYIRDATRVTNGVSLDLVAYNDFGASSNIYRINNYERVVTYNGYLEIHLATNEFITARLSFRTPNNTNSETLNVDVLNSKDPIRLKDRGFYDVIISGANLTIVENFVDQTGLYFKQGMPPVDRILFQQNNANISSQIVKDERIPITFINRTSQKWQDFIVIQLKNETSTIRNLISTIEKPNAGDAINWNTHGKIVVDIHPETL